MDRTEAMPDEELATMLAEHESRAIGYYTSEIASAQENAINRYYRRAYGDEQEGRSKVVDGTVSIVVDNAVAAILKPFVSSEDTVEFKPRGPEDEDAAKQATEYVNYVFQNDCNGFLVLHDWVKEALLLKLGIVKVWWEDKTRKRMVLREGLDGLQAQIVAQQGVEVYGPDENGLFAANVEEDYEDGCIRVENVPVEEYRISPYARSGRTPPYEAHVRNIARSELIEMGFDADVVMSLSKYSTDQNEDSRSQARYQDEELGSTRIDVPGDASRELIKVCEEYVLVDYDGDGVSELRKVIRCENVILFNEEVDEGPFATLCPVPMPHKVVGLSLADLVLDEQRVATVVLRQTLDNLYLTNTPRPQIPLRAERDDGSTIDDLLNHAPGAPIRVKDEPMVPFVIPFMADKSFPMLQYVEHQVEQRTGISKVGQGMDSEALASAGQITATQSAIMEDGRNERSEMIARIFAETGIKRLFRLMLKLLINHQPRERMIRLRNEWVPIDPRGWNPELDMSISVGLGVGSKQQQLQQAQLVVTAMGEVAQTPFATLINPEKAFNALKRLFTAAGIKNTDDFLVEPEKDEQGNLAQQEPAPDPEMMKAQAEAQIKAAELEGKQQEMAAKMEMAREEAGLKLQLERERAAAAIEAQREEAAMRAQLERDKASFEAEMARDRFAAELAMERERLQMERERQAEEAEFRKLRPGGDLAK